MGQSMTARTIIAVISMATYKQHLGNIYRFAAEGGAMYYEQDGRLLYQMIQVGDCSRSPDLKTRGQHAVEDTI